MNKQAIVDKQSTDVIQVFSLLSLLVLACVCLLYSGPPIELSLPSIKITGPTDDQNIFIVILYAFFGALGGLVSVMFERASGEDKRMVQKKMTTAYWMCCGAGSGLLGGIFAGGSTHTNVHSVGIAFAAGIAWKGIIPQALSYVKPDQMNNKQQLTSDRFNGVARITEQDLVYCDKTWKVQNTEVLFVAPLLNAIRDSLPTTFVRTPQRFNFETYKQSYSSNPQSTLNQLRDGLKALLVNLIISKGTQVQNQDDINVLLTKAKSQGDGALSQLANNIEMIYGIIDSGYDGEIVINDGQFDQVVLATKVVCAEALFYLASKRGFDKLKEILDDKFCSHKAPAAPPMPDGSLVGGEPQPHDDTLVKDSGVNK